MLIRGALVNVCVIFALCMLLKLMWQASRVGKQVGHVTIYVLQSDLKHRSFYRLTVIATGYFFVLL
jgi:hypothetical protein